VDRHAIETAAAVLVPLTTWAVVTGVSWYLTWVYLGPVTIGAESVPPAVLAVTVVAVTVWKYCGSSSLSVSRPGLDGLAVVILSTAVWAVATLTLTTPGLYVGD
jgi:hypothetical protein